MDFINVFQKADVVSAYNDFAKALPPEMPSCGFNSELCDQKGTIIIVISVMAAVSVAVMVFLCVRRMRSGETAAMPWAISANTINFIEFEFNGSSVRN